MSSTADPYREWNGAYVLGALPPSERREYEQHLSECTTCARAVASLAGMAGILSTVQVASAMALLDDEDASGGKGSPANTLPNLLLAAQRQRRRARAAVAVLVVVVAAIAAAIAVHLPSLNLSDPPAGHTDRVAIRCEHGGRELDRRTWLGNGLHGDDQSPRDQIGGIDIRLLVDKSIVVLTMTF